MFTDNTQFRAFWYGTNRLLANAVFLSFYVNTMARTPSNMLALGTTAPDFDLPDSRTQQSYEWKDIQGSQGTLIVFICNHCPFVIHLIEPLVALSNDYLKKGIGIAFISSNDVLHYPQDGPEEMQKFADKYGMEFPYLYDESQQTAIDYQAACTPDFYLFNDQKGLFTEVNSMIRAREMQ